MSRRLIDLHIPVTLAALLLAFLFAAAAAFAHEDEEEHKIHWPLETVSATRITDGKTFSNNPAGTIDHDGTVWTTWIQHHTDAEQDEVVVARAGEKPVVLTATRGQYLRPVIAAAGDQLLCVWTTTQHDHVSTVWQSRYQNGKWSKAERLAPQEKRAHQNPEIAGRSDGTIAVVYQVHTGTDYDIHAKVGDEFSVVNETRSNDWDPTVVFDSAGTMHVAWSGFERGDYDIFWKRGDAAPRRISDRGQYDLHPWLTASPDGSVWATWDVAEVPGHALSGETTITGANLGAKIPSNYGSGEKHGIAVRVLDGDTVRTPGDPLAQIVPFGEVKPMRGRAKEVPDDHRSGHGSLPKIGIGPDGHAWVIYRVLRRTEHGNWLPQFGSMYHWDLLARPFTGEGESGGKWGNPVRFQDSDGYLEEADVAIGKTGVHVIFGGEQRAESGARMKRKPAPPKDPANHHHDFDGRVGCNGEVYTSLLVAGESPAVKVSSIPQSAPPKEASSRLRGRGKSYEVTTGGKTFRLLWGDTHRHSNVSRCSVGIEPSPDDLYRYGDDICNYDFFALSDHGIHLRNSDADASNYYWYLNLKLADLYHVPDYMSVLYNFEWTMRFPNGHRNVIFPGRPTLRMDFLMDESRDLTKGWKYLEQAGMKAITIPHTSADPEQGTDWEAHDDRYQRVIEIFQSARGSYEHEGCPRQFHRTQNKKGSYWKALEKGHHIGVIASSDHGYGVAYACVYAEENSREAIWQAMWDRRCYGSTTYGLVLDMRSGDHWMGEEWKSKEAPVIDVHVEAAAPIRSVEIIGRSQVLHAEGSEKEPLRKRTHKIRWSDPDWDKQGKEQWYYVRVIQTDDEIAWSSPIWVTPSETAGE